MAVEPHSRPMGRNVRSGGGGARRARLHIPDGERTAVVNGESPIRSSASGKDEGGCDDALHPKRVVCEEDCRRDSSRAALSMLTTSNLYILLGRQNGPVQAPRLEDNYGLDSTPSSEQTATVGLPGTAPCGGRQHHWRQRECIPKIKQPTRRTTCQARGVKAWDGCIRSFSMNSGRPGSMLSSCGRRDG